MDYVWWYALGTERMGPVSAAQLEQLLRTGVINDDTWVWRSGLPRWVNLGDAAELAYLHDPSPPALPRRRASVRSMPLAGPWRRFCARMIDISLLSFPAGVMFGAGMAVLVPSLAQWITGPSPVARLVLGLILLPMSLLAEAAIFGIFGTTPGKFVLGLRVITASGGFLGFKQYLGRTAELFFRGLAMGIPIVSLFALHGEYRLVKAGKPSSYDVGRFSVRAPPIGPLALVAAVTLVIGLIAVNGMVQLGQAGTSKKYSTGFDWINPVTERHAAIAPGVHDARNSA